MSVLREKKLVCWNLFVILSLTVSPNVGAKNHKHYSQNLRKEGGGYSVNVKITLA